MDWPLVLKHLLNEVCQRGVGVGLIRYEYRLHTTVHRNDILLIIHGEGLKSVLVLRVRRMDLHEHQLRVVLGHGSEQLWYQAVLLGVDVGDS